MNNPIFVTRASMPPIEEYMNQIKPLWDSAWLTNMGIIHQQFETELLSYLRVPNLSLSLYNGVPVVTLDHCDVANFVSKEDVCANEIEMLERIEKYITDPVYYEMKSKDAENIRLQLSETNLTMSTNELFDEVKKIAVLRDSYSS